MADLFAFLPGLNAVSVPDLAAEWGPIVLVFLATTAALLLVFRRITRGADLEEARLEKVRPESLPGTPQADGLFGSLTPALAAQIPESAKEKRDFRLLLRQAGLHGPTVASTLYALRFVLLFVPLVTAAVLAILDDSGHSLPILVAGGFAAAILSILPRLFVYFRRRRRYLRIRQALPDTIDMLSMCSSGGLALGESLEHVAGQLSAYPEMAQELRIVKSQTEVGSLNHALHDFTLRVDLPEARQLANLLLRGGKLGTQLAGSLHNQADHLRVARRQAAMTQVNKTPVKLVLPILFCFAPAALIVLTGPAMLEFRDFFLPSPEQAAQAQPGDMLNTGRMVGTLQQLDQRVELAPIVGETAAPMAEPGR